MDLIGVKIKTDIGIINVIGIYRRPGGTEEKGTWSELINKINGNRCSNEDIIIAGDMNAHPMELREYG